MSNSPLVDHVHISPNHYSGRRYPITKVTPHYCDGNPDVIALGNMFAPASRRASSNYGIDSAGRVGMYVEESDAPWTSSSYDNDNRAITIEVANMPDSSITPEAWEKLVTLCADICIRNGIPQLTWTGTKDGTLTVHRMFTDTSCPGEWLMANMPRLAAEVNARIAGGVAPSQPQITVDGWWGEATTRRMQELMRFFWWPEHPVDGQIWHQWRANWNPALTTGWHWDYKAEGDVTIRGLQDALANTTDPSVVRDGIMGTRTISALQRALGTPDDGRLDGPSRAVMQLQDNMNHGVLWYLDGAGHSVGWR